MNLYLYIIKKIKNEIIQNDNIESYVFWKNMNFHDYTYQKNFTILYLNIFENKIKKCKKICNDKSQTIQNDNDIIKQKYIFINDFINNVFISMEKKEYFLNILSKIQKIYNVFSKIAFLYKYKKSAITSITTDLTLNPIKDTDKNVICIYQNNTIYLFTISDLVNMLNNSLSYSPHMFSELFLLKNPYNNIPFSKPILYHIYFFMKSKPIIMPELFHKYFLCNFNLEKFENENQEIIRDYAIESYVNNSLDNVLCEDILNMIFEYNMILNNHYLYIDEDFPEKKLVKIMKPYLRLYYIVEYSLNKYKSNQASKKLKSKLIKFIHYNPNFGRKMIKNIFLKKENNTTHTSLNVDFNDKHIDFNDK